MYDRYSSPHPEEETREYEEGPMGRAQEMGGDALEMAKANWKKIAAALAVIAVLFFAYDFFIGSVKAVSFAVVDTEGNEIPGAAVRVLSEGGQEIARLSTGESASLRAGAYKIDVSAQGYRAVRGKPIMVSDSFEMEETLQADKDLGLSGAFPETFA